MYYDEDMAEVAEDPVSDVKEALSHCQLHGLESACPQCLENQRQLVRQPLSLSSSLARYDGGKSDRLYCSCLTLMSAAALFAVVRTDCAEVRVVSERGGGSHTPSSRAGAPSCHLYGRRIHLLTEKTLFCISTAPAGGYVAFHEGSHAGWSRLLLMSLCPAVQISDAVDKGKNQLAALGAATPLLADAMALSMPCREMCDAVMSSCSCGKERTFGELLQSVIDDQNLVGAQGPLSSLVRIMLPCYDPAMAYQAKYNGCLSHTCRISLRAALSSPSCPVDMLLVSRRNRHRGSPRTSPSSSSAACSSSRCAACSPAAARQASAATATRCPRSAATRSTGARTAILARLWCSSSSLPRSQR